MPSVALLLVGCAPHTVYYGDGDITVQFTGADDALSGEVAIPAFDGSGLEELTTVHNALLVEQGGYAAFDEVDESLVLEAWLPYPVDGLQLPVEDEPTEPYTRFNLVLRGGEDGSVSGLIGLSGDDRVTSTCYPGDLYIDWEGQADGLAARREGSISGMTTWQTSDAEDCIGTQSLTAKLEITWDLAAERRVQSSTYDGWD